MKQGIISLLFLLLVHNGNAQQQNIIDSLNTIINQQKEDTNKVGALIMLSLLDAKLDNAIKYLQQGLAISQSIKYKRGEARCFLAFANVYGYRGNRTQEIKYVLYAL